MDKTTLGGIISAVGTILSGLGYFWEPLFLIGSFISAGGKAYMGAEAVDKKS